MAPSVFRGGRHFVALVLALFLIAGYITPAFAGVTGNINGTVTGPNGAPLSGVAVDAVSPSNRAHATTDARGFYSLQGLVPDTYTISFTSTGYQNAIVNGVNVAADQTLNVSQPLSRQLQTIGKTTARSQGSAYQPNQTTDTYTITNQQITVSQGRENNNNEVTLVGSLPGAQTDSSGYPSLRGGRENEIGFQYEGLDYVEPYSNQFANSLVLNGVGSLQLSPGAGNASQGNAGTGVINLLAKRGTNPAFGLISLEAAPQTFWHDGIGEYGFATPNGRFSNYFKYIGQRQAELYGQNNQNLPYILEANGNSFNTLNDFVNNMIYKFGKDQSKSLQLFYEGQVVQYAVGAGLPQGQTFYRTGDIAANTSLANTFNLLGATFTPAQVAAGLSFYPGQTDQNQLLNDHPGYNQPLQALKLQFNDAISSKLYANARFYRLAAVTTFDFPTTVPTGSNSYRILQGGSRTGFATDFTYQLNDKNLLTFGGKYDRVTPVFSFDDPRSGFFNLLGFGGQGFSAGQGAEAFDFYPNNAVCPGTSIGVPCGYLYGNNPTGTNYFPTGVRIPAPIQNEPYQRQEYALYLNDAVTFSSKLKGEFGARFDGANYNIGNATKTYGIDPKLGSFDDSVNKPTAFQPRVGLSFSPTTTLNFRGSYGRSIQYPFFSSQVATIDRSAFNQFNGVPAFDNLSGKVGSAVTFCGPSANLPCSSYADQLYWENQNSTGLPVFAVRPEKFDNYDFSISKAFKGNVAVKLTPFYRTGKDLLATTNAVLGIDSNGAPILGPSSTTNRGISKTTGVEFLLTKDAEYGFSGQLTATYVNEFTNTPPLQSQEDVFPSISPDSLALGKVYRVGFLSPFVAQLSAQYHSRSGWRINPVVQYTKGYPYNQGSTTAFNVNGQSVIVPTTNLTAFNGPNLTSSYVDPANPGTFANPKLVATRGTAETSDPGGLLTNARFNTNLTIEYNKPNSRFTYGVQLLGLFNNVYGYPQLNDQYQPLADGVAGSRTGVVANGNPAYVNPYVNNRGTLPYIIVPNNNYSFTAQTQQAPLLSLFYVQVKL